jgi:hypothetical protein
MKMFVLILGLSVVGISAGVADTGHRSKGAGSTSCGDMVKVKHPGLKGAAFNKEYAVCANDKDAYGK